VPATACAESGQKALWSADLGAHQAAVLPATFTFLMLHNEG